MPHTFGMSDVPERLPGLKMGEIQQAGIEPVPATGWGGGVVKDGMQTLPSCGCCAMFDWNYSKKL